MWFRGSLLTLAAHDLSGASAGEIVDTYPCDGSSPEFAVVRLGRFGRRVMVPLDGVAMSPGAVRFPQTMSEIEDAPDLDCGRYQCDRVSIARAYWAVNASGEKLAVG